MGKFGKAELLVLGIILAQIWWVVEIKYPPTPEQLGLGITYFWQLWLVRGLSLGLLWLATVLLDKAWFRVVFFLIPSTAFWWMAYPLVVLRIFLVALGYWGLKKVKNKGLKLIFGFLGVGLLLLYNGLVVKDLGNFGESLDLVRNQTEVGTRINTENTLKERVELPMWFRRISYNKYFFVMRNLATNALQFSDMESLFFQEVHPMGLKSGVLFFWPYVWLLGISLFFLMLKRLKLPLETGWLVLMAWVGYLFSDKTADVRLSLVVIPLAILLTNGWQQLLKINKLGKMVAVGLMVFVSLGYLSDLRDRWIRSEFWLDNRPMAYDFFYKNILNNRGAGDKVVVSSLVGPADLYCRFYIKDCSNFEFRNFDLITEKPKDGVLYAGFGGNFLGKTVGEDLHIEANPGLGSGMKILAMGKVFDGIAFGYGKQLLVAGYLWNK